MRTIPVVLCLFVTLLAGCAAPSAKDEAPASPYLDQQDSPVRGLSTVEIEELQTGAGMGLARPAELNGYPGPLHVLELADKLEMGDDQRAAVQDIRQEMLDEAVPLGERILSAYAALEEAFRTHAIDEDSLRMRLDRIADLYEALRFVHLVAHLETASVLNEHQTMRYIELRGYDTPGQAGEPAAGSAQDPQAGHAGHGG